MIHWGLRMVSFDSNNYPCELHIWLNLGVPYSAPSFICLCTLKSHILCYIVMAVNDSWGIVVILQNYGISYVDLFKCMFLFFLTIPSCVVVWTLNLKSDFKQLSNPWVVFAIRSGSEILSVFLVRLNLILYTTNFSSRKIDWVVYYILMHSNILNSCGSSPISNV